MKPLTVTQQLVFEVICDLWREHGRSPTYAEIAEEMRYTSKNAAAEHVKRLEEKGWIEPSNGERRCVIPVGMKDHIAAYVPRKTCTFSNYLE